MYLCIIWRSLWYNPDHFLPRFYHRYRVHQLTTLFYKCIYVLFGGHYDTIQIIVNSLYLWFYVMWQMNLEDHNNTTATIKIYKRTELLSCDLGQRQASPIFIGTHMPQDTRLSRSGMVLVGRNGGRGMLGEEGPCSLHITACDHHLPISVHLEADWSTCAQWKGVGGEMQRLSTDLAITVSLVMLYHPCTPHGTYARRMWALHDKSPDQQAMRKHTSLPFNIYTIVVRFENRMDICCIYSLSV